MIEFERVSVSYDGAEAPVLREVDLLLPEGELCLVVGSTGSGKSTLLGCVNGLVPHFTGGRLSGRVTVAGRDTRTHPPRELADVVGVVGQNPSASFVADTVEDELAYTMESLGLAPDVMRRRVEDTLDLLGLVELRDRPVSTLSGGQAQRVAIGAVLTAHPRVLVLDEPTSALDPSAAEDVLAAVQRLVHDLGLTVLMAEHRLERVVQYADTVLWLPGGGAPVEFGAPPALMARTPIAPPVVELGRALGWDPLPLTVRDARRPAVALRERLPATPRPTARPVAGEVLAHAHRLSVRYGTVGALREVDVQVRAGEVLALMGRNGAGKSSLLAAFTGSVRPAGGEARVGGLDPRGLRGRALTDRVGLVPQQPADLLYGETVAAECAQADRDAAAPAGTCARLLLRIAGELDGDRHPRDLSEGQRLALALAVVLASAPPLVLLDEPTRGLDYPAKTRLVAVLRELAADWHAVVLATHDVELAAEVSSRTIVLADGEVVADGPSREVVLQTPMFAPQVAKILAPLPYLTVPDVVETLAAAHVESEAG
ncbi:ATP-binding cassette domain-containing protein [Jatrophihabitans cynanchi]|uniref:ATP-binding cassette domain-containing protein n=1 Tax=Jatrophihabitans cynanchi TaxID=2944128 RepID=A0ABY7JZQ7_9ACTN|nr:ABC transporter ATP-binding protein [Jatrophihabitans sp. SB3-54]WAX58047.1 ATP-binding cassette domain-containing protein [Jatrophihabitans sp. SB3-54]